MGRKYQICNNVLSVGLRETSREANHPELQRIQEEVYRILTQKKTKSAEESIASHESIVELEVDY